MSGKEEILNILAAGEGYNAEFKVSVPSKVRELTTEVCAFANSSGGVLLIGVNDRNEIAGAKLDNVVRSAIQDSLLGISPHLHCTLEVVKIEGKEVGVIRVPCGTQKPYVFSGSIYVRIGANTQKLVTAEQMREFFQRSDKLYFDETACNTFHPNQDFDQQLFDHFISQSGIPTRISRDQVLKNLQLFAEEGSFKRGAVLFFGKYPETFFDHAIIRCVAFKGTTKRFIIDSKTYGGNLYNQYLGAMDWIKGKLNVAYQIEGQMGGPRKEVWEIPLDVFKEAIINALSHRDYYEKGAVTTVEMFIDRVEISNPGDLLEAVAKDFGQRSLSRNPLIFGLFHRMNMVEKIGSGIPRMKELMQMHHLPEPRYKTEGMFTIILHRHSDFAKQKGLLLNKIDELAPESQYPDNLKHDEITILSLIEGDARITIPQLAEKISKSPETIKRLLKKLQDSNLLERKGSARVGTWHVKIKR